MVKIKRRKTPVITTREELKEYLDGRFLLTHEERYKKEGTLTGKLRLEDKRVENLKDRVLRIRKNLGLSTSKGPADDSKVVKD